MLLNPFLYLLGGTDTAEHPAGMEPSQIQSPDLVSGAQSVTT